MRFVLVKCAGREEEFPDHVQWRATCGEAGLDHFFWSHAKDGEIGAKEFIRKRYPNATFSDEMMLDADGNRSIFDDVDE